MIKKGFANSIRILTALATIVTLGATVRQLARAYSVNPLTIEADIRFAFVWLALFVVCVCGLWLSEKVYARIPYPLSRNQTAVLNALMSYSGTVHEVNTALQWNPQTLQGILDQLHNRYLVTRIGSDAKTYSISEKGKRARLDGYYFYHFFGK
jgi:hypothetical protein